MNYISKFIQESNAIEGIHRFPLDTEIVECSRFLDLHQITIDDLKKFVSVYAPGNQLRDKPNLNVTIGGRLAPKGGKTLVTSLQNILGNMWRQDSFATHVQYEMLHPFTDGNGRSGRMLWLWQRKRELGKMPALSFLHSFYYQTLKDAATKYHD